MTPWFGRIQNGRIKLHLKEKFHDHIRSLRDGQFIALFLQDGETASISSDRKYYFKVVMGEAQAETGHSKLFIHEIMKTMFALDDNGEVRSVFSDQSDMTPDERKQFVEDVRYFLSDFLDLNIPEKGRCENHVL